MATQKSNAAVKPSDALPLASELTITRVIDAPRELVFRMWTEPEHLVQWCVLGGMTNSHIEHDVRQGGNWVVRLVTAEGVEINARRVYREIKSPERIVFYEKCEMAGKVILDGVHTITLVEQAGKTRLTVSVALATPFDTQNQQGWSGGWSELFDRLAAHVAQV